MAISNLGELNTEVSKMAAAMIESSLSPSDTVAIIDKNSGMISTIQHVKIEEHWAGDPVDEGVRMLIGRTIWLVVEEQ